MEELDLCQDYFNDECCYINCVKRKFMLCPIVTEKYI
jgi:hypothetical protein